jgi:hypothetical protein
VISPTTTLTTAIQKIHLMTRAMRNRVQALNRRSVHAV